MNTAGETRRTWQQKLAAIVDALPAWMKTRPRFLKKSIYAWLFLIRNCLIATIFAAVLFQASTVLLGSRLIVESGQAMSFLSRLSEVPPDPVVMFFGCLAGLGVLEACMISRSDTTITEERKNRIGALIEILAAVVISALLHFSYSGVLLMVLCDCLYHFRNVPKTKWILFVIIGLYFCANYQLISHFVPLADYSLYFEVFPTRISASLILIKNLFDMVSFILCLSYLGVFLSWQLDENQSIMDELSMLSQVNHDLRNYAAVTEKIGEDKERKRLAREIHDTLGHALTGIAAGVDASVAIIDKNPQAARSQLMMVSRVVRQGISDVRSSLKKLRPGALEEQGFRGALQKMIEEISSVSDLKVSLQFEADGLDLEVVKEDALFRMIQESITNSLRHGGADWISIHLYIEDTNLKVTIRDNGIGCEEIHTGFGLKQMQERAAILRGSVSFDGSNGFETRIILPLSSSS